MRSFSFINTVVVVNGVPLTGWADGDDAIQIKRLADTASHKMGAGGNMMVSVSTDESGSFMFKLQKTSSSNAFLNNLEKAQRIPGSFVPIYVLSQDVVRQDQGIGSAGYIKKPADMTQGAVAGNQEWELVVESLTLVFGDIDG